MSALSLNDAVATLGPFAKRIAPQLAPIGVKTIGDLLFYFPFRHEDWSDVVPVSSVVPGNAVTIQGVVKSIEKKFASWRRSTIVNAIIEDSQHGTIRAIWFHSPYLVQTLKAGTAVRLSGKAEKKDGALRLVHPTWEKADTGPQVHTGRLVPIYHLSGHLTQKQIRSAIAVALKRITTIPDFLPAAVKRTARLPDLDRATRAYHFPKNWGDKNEAERRLKFDELFLLQLRGSIARHETDALTAPRITFAEEAVKTFVKKLPFALTQAQRKAGWEIIGDLNKHRPMNRLLEGDVGSGKTVVAALAALNTLSSGNQTAYLAPTSILAAQQYETFCRLFASQPYTIALITQGDIRLQSHKSLPKADPPQAEKTRSQNVTRISKKELENLLKDGTIDIAIGTHALFSEHISLHRLALVIVDEQHRFGVRQRAALLRRPTLAPHLLSMTATPIPRSLALVAYGDLDISLLDEKPAGRADITTTIIRPEHRKKAYDLMKAELAAGHQAFIICPLIDPSDTLGVKSVTEEVKRLTKEHFPDHRLDILHGRMSAEKKDRIMREFTEGTTQVLVSTPVIEVGIDVPNATCILIESAERFGLAQLHQLRGRVGRGDAASWCLLASDSENEEAFKRLHALVQSQDGFRLAEIDLDMRGPGQLYGTTQSGFLDELKIAKLTDTIILKQSKEAVSRLLAEDAALTHYPAIKSRLAQFEQSVHFE